MCFQRAGAFEATPSAAVTQWWDELAALAYANTDAGRIAIGRQAERLSLDYERACLAGSCDAPALIWKALDTNAAGYDIQSWWRPFGGDWSPKYIEVKGSQRDPPTLFLTRHEWSTAIRLAGSYVFQVWDLTSGRMAELSVAQMSSHVPSDNGQGLWQEAKVQLDGIDWSFIG